MRFASHRSTSLAFALATFWLLSGDAFGQSAKTIQWESDLKTAHARAQQENKHLLLHFYSDNCVWCDRLEAGAFKSPQVIDAINENYVALKIHAGKNPSLAKTFRVASFPTDVIVTTSGTALAHGTSPQAADRYVAMLAQHLPKSPGPAATGDQTMLAQNVSPSQSVVSQNPYGGDGISMPPTIGTNAATANMPEQAPVTAKPEEELVAAKPTSGGVTAMPVAHRSVSTPTEAPATEQPRTLAMDGYCAVTLLEKNQWIEGNPKFGVIHLGHLYLFVDAEAMKRFLADPEPFTPVLNGIDVVRFFEEKRIVQGKRDFGVRDPDHNRMFFFADEAALIHFENQHARYTEAAISVTRQATAEANPRR